MSAWDDPALTGSLGDRIADDLRTIVRAYSAGDERSQQTNLGPSQIGNPCTRCLAEQILGIDEPPPFDDPWARVIGTAIHAWLEEAAVYDNIHVVRDAARWHTEKRVHPHPDLLPSGGKCDLYDAETRTVIDHKTTSAERLRKYRLNGPGLQYRRQAHLYGLGYARTGAAVDHVALAFWQRGGRLRDLYVWTEPYDADMAMDALNRYRTLKELCEASGPGIAAALPSDPDCFVCGRKASTGAVINNPAQTIPA